METITFSSRPELYKRGYKHSNISISDEFQCELIDMRTSNEKQFQVGMDFYWNEEEIERITGTVTLCYSSGNGFGSWVESETSVDLSKPGLTIGKVFDTNFHVMYTSYRYSLTIHRSHCLHRLYEKMFSPSEQSDAVLLVGDKKLHVNKAFLSCHSTYFRSLFAKQADTGILIEGVTYDEFGLLMSTIYPEMVLSTDKTAELLLRLGDRFKMPAVMHHVETRLIEWTQLTDQKLMFLADKFKLQKLLERTISWIDFLDDSRMLKESAEYSELSDSTKAKILDRLNSLPLSNENYTNYSSDGYFNRDVMRNILFILVGVWLHNTACLIVSFCKSTKN